MEYPDCYITAMRACYKKDGCHGRQAYIIDIGKAESLWRCIFQMGRLGI